MKLRSRPLLWALAAGLVLGGLGACTEEPVRPEDRLSTALEPTQPPGYYVDQANRYFDALDESADPESLPTYAERVARWEWPPWLLLTGYGATDMAAIDEAVKALTPATVPARDCRFFAEQPFARCRVVFAYDEGDCPIYEEFTFNDQGEITFIEAWSDQPGLRPTADASDVWAEGPGAHRLSTRIPGLGSPTGRIDLDSPAMARAADADPEVADFVARARDFWDAWMQAYDAAGDDLFARGCGWAP